MASFVGNGINHFQATSSSDALPLRKSQTTVNSRRNLAQTNQLLRLYRPYVIKDWKNDYFRYDFMKSELKAAALNELQQNQFRNILNEEIKRVDDFLFCRIKELKECLDSIASESSLVGSEYQQQQVFLTNEFERHSLERSFRRVYAKAKMLESYYDLNEFLISKIRAKAVHLYNADLRSHNIKGAELQRSDQIVSLARHVSRSEVNAIQESCERAYASFFMPLYPWLAHGDLQFVKTPQKINKGTYLRIGFKMGIILVMVTLAIMASFFHDYSSDPGLDAFLAVSDYLLFRLTWAVNIWVWDKWEIDYIKIMDMQSKNYYKPNYIQIINDILNIQVLLFVGIVMYFAANALQSTSPFLTVSLPFAAVLVICAFIAYSRLRKGDKAPPRDLFSLTVLWRCISAPFYPVTFRDTYAADVLTSFYMLIFDASSGFCWIFTGGIMARSNAISQLNFYQQCGTSTMKAVVTLIHLIPFSIRSLQCSRKWYESKDFYSLHGLNLLKYLLSMLTILLDYVNFRKSSIVVFYLIVVLVTIFKWYWDVAVDWKLFEILPTTDCWSPQKVFLRANLIYKDARYYYAAIVIDLILRFIYVLSLTGSAGIALTGTTHGFTRFYGSIEVMRRCMWGFLRVEVEHIDVEEKRLAASKLKMAVKADTAGEVSSLSVSAEGGQDRLVLAGTAGPRLCSEARRMEIAMDGSFIVVSPLQKSL